MIQPPCQGCPDRRMGCHDPRVCARWAEFQRKREAEAASRPSHQELAMVAEYIKQRRKRYQTQRWRRGKHRA